MLGRWRGRLKENLDEFRGSEAGQRFKDRYHRRRKNERGHMALRVFNIAFGTVLALGSLVFAPLPGPGFLTVFLGLAIVAGEVLYAARFLDWAELRVRDLIRLVGRLWRRSAWGKALVLVAAALVLAGVATVAYGLYFR